MAISVSIAVATYNGERYVREQLDSILASIAVEDEVVISDDGSTDGTLAILEAYVIRDSRVKLLHGPGEGVIRNFDFAVASCRGDVILLSDQDDVWNVEKVDTVRKIFERDSDLMCLVHDVAVVDANLRPIAPSYFTLRYSKPGLGRNLIKNRYLGMAMAVHRDLVAISRPFPVNATMHDQWLGLNSELFGKSLFLHKVLGVYRRHDQNVTELNSRGTWSSVARKRITMSYLLVRQFFRVRVWSPIYIGLNGAPTLGGVNGE